MTTGHYAYFEKDGVVKKEPLIKWARFRRMGYRFATIEEYNAYQSGNAPAEVAPVVADVPDTPAEEGDLLPTMENTKAEILAFAKVNDVDVNAEDTKAALIETIEDALG